MKLVVVDPKIVAKMDVIFTNLLHLTDIVSIRVGNTGLQIQGTDQCKICMFDIKLHKELFYLYQIQDITVFTVSVRIFQKVLSTYKSDQTLELFITNVDKLNMHLVGGKTTCDKLFQLPLIDMNDEVHHISNEETDVEIYMTSKKFTELVSQLETFNNDLTFDLSEEHVNLKTEGEYGCMTAILSLDDMSLIDYSIIEDNNICVSYNLKYIKIMSAFSKVSKEVKLEINQNKLLMMSYKLESESMCKFILASIIKETFSD